MSSRSALPGALRDDIKNGWEQTRPAADLTRARVDSLARRKYPTHARKTSGPQGSFQAIVEVFQLVSQTNLSNTLIHFDLKPFFSSFFSWALTATISDGVSFYLHRRVKRAKRQ